MPGPLPNPQSRRRNAPSVASTVLPAKRSGAVPKPPASYALGVAGLGWWRWAWRLGQATMWDAGAVYFVARRAALEDELAALDFNDSLDLADLLAGADGEAVRNVEFALATLKRSATGATSLMKEMRELDNRLGLNPKAMADLRWSIAEKPVREAPCGDDVARLDEYRGRTG